MKDEERGKVGKADLREMMVGETRTFYGLDENAMNTAASTCSQQGKIDGYSYTFKRNRAEQSVTITKSESL